MIDTSNDTCQQLEVALTHMQANRLREAAEICTNIISNHPDDADALHLLGTLLLKIGKPAVAIRMLKRAVTCQPNCALAYNSLGLALHRTGCLKDAVSTLDKAVSLAQDLHEARQNRDAIMAEIKAVEDEITLLEERNAAPTVTFTKEEQERSSISLQSLNRAASLYDHFGFLLIEGLYDESFIARLNNYFRNKYSAYFEDKDYSDALSVGDKRSMISIALDGPFNDSLFYGHPLMRPLFERLLGKDYILGSLGAVISLPGATLQHLHADGGDLFGDNMKSSITIPAYAITMGIPLIEMNTTTGTTRMFQKSHHALPSSIDNQKGIDPIIKAGSCVLFDYRIQHQGTPNISGNIRPLLYNIYYRPWFRDSFNYSKQAHLMVSDEEATKIPSELHGLFKWRMAPQKKQQ